MRKTLSILLTTAALLGNPNIANCEDSASHRVTMSVQPMRILYVNENEDIIGVRILSDGVNFPEDKIIVYKNGSRTFLDDKIKSQYYTYLSNPEIAQIDWSNKPGLRYYPTDPQALKDFEAKRQESISNGTFTPTTNETLEDGVLYYTVTEDQNSILDGTFKPAIKGTLETITEQ
jgi:hypothetical protein